MGILEQLRTTKFRELPFRTKVITGAVKLGLVLILILVLGIGPCGGEVVVTIEKKGEGTVTGAGAYGKNLQVPITATPADGWKFDHWSGGTVTNPNAASTTITILDENQEITANFTQLQYTLQIEVAGGTATGDSTDYLYGQEVTIVATPDKGWKFDSWVGDPVADPTSPTTTVIMDGHKLISAIFTRLPQHTLTVLKQGEGEAYAYVGGSNYGGPDAGTYSEGEEVPIVAAPAFGWEFDRWVGDNVKEPYSEFTNVTMEGDTEVTAIFTPTTPPASTTVVLDYTDGTFDGYSGHYPGGQFAVRFTAEQPSQVVAAEFYITDNPAPFQVGLYDGNREVIEEVTANPTTTGWFRVELPGSPVAEGDFYVAIVYTNDSAPLIGRDSTEPQGRSWVVDPDGTWAPWSEKAQEFDLLDGEFGIRVELE